MERHPRNKVISYYYRRHRNPATRPPLETFLHRSAAGRGPMNGLSTTLRSVAVALSPRVRWWWRFLPRLPLDPDRLPRPVAQPGPRDFIICGCPRTGTTMLVGMLWQPPRVLVCSEPWDAFRLEPAALFRSLREEIATTGQLGRGRKFLVCLRHPYEVVPSFVRTSPRLAVGIDHNIPFNRAMNAALRAYPDPAVRRVKLYDTINARILDHLHRPNVLPVRYERWFNEPEMLRAEIGAFLGVKLGPGPIRLRRPAGVPDEATRALVRAHCETARPLGYALD